MPSIAGAAPRERDAFVASSARATITAADRAALRRASKLGTEVQLERRLGVPTTLWAAEAAPGTGTPAGAARGHLKRLAPLYGLSPADVNSATLASIHDTGRGGIIVSLRHSVDGVPVLGEEASVLMTRDLGLEGIGGYLAPTDGAVAEFSLDARVAVARAAEDLTGTTVDAGSLKPAGRDGSYEHFAAPYLARPARAKRVMYRLPQSLVPAHYVEVSSREGDEHFAYVIGAADGRILSRQSLVSEASYSYRVWADGAAPHAPWEGPHAGVGFPHPTGTPNGYVPPFASPSLVTLQNGPIGTNDPWLPDGATETVGNNVDTYADLFSPSGFQPANGDIRATATAAGVFDRTYDTAAAPDASTDQIQAGITQAFYTTNFLHDWFYEGGFDEESGIAQADNFGRGGVDGDRMLVETQDHGGSNNANMLTPADGASPRMQVYAFRGPETSTLTVDSPPEIARGYAHARANFGPASFDLTDTLALVNDGSGVSNTDGCEPFTGMSGVIALIDRGQCGFERKVANAQDAGAVGAVIVNNVASPPLPTLGGDNTITPDPSIPALAVTLNDGNAIKSALASGPVQVSMQRAKLVDRDGAIDNHLVTHEWGHYLVQRLSNGLSGSQGGALDEGWADFVALLTSVRAEDVAAGVSGIHPFASYAYRGVSPDSHYFGSRRYPYSTSFAKNALTFTHIADGVPPPVGVPTSGVSQNSEVHNAGEVWASMLWESYAALLAETLEPSPRLTFAQAQRRMRDYLVTSLKLTPPNPTFIDARDALLMAAGANDDRDAALFWEAFARRGAGVGAVAPDIASAQNQGVVESFETSSLEVVSTSLEDDVESCDSGDGYLDNGEHGLLRITIRNRGTRRLESTAVTVNSTNPRVQIADSTLTVPPTDALETVEVSTDVTLAGASGLQELSFDIVVGDEELTTGVPGTATHTTVGGVNVVPDASADDDVSSPASAWLAETDLGTAGWERVSSFDPYAAHWHGPDAGAASDASLVSPPLEAGSGPVSFSFSHRFAFESTSSMNFDGGVIELSTDGGATWVDADTVGDTSYNGTLTTSDNPLAGRSAYVARSPGYPAFGSQTIDLGTAFAGQTLRVRFRIGTDESVGAPGWDVDDISFTGLTNTPFTDLVEDPGCPEPPAAVTGLTATAGVRLVALDWNDTPGATGYEVFRRDPAGAYPSSPTSIVSASAFTDSGRVPGTEYCYTVRAVGAGGTGATSGEACATALGVTVPPPDTVAPELTHISLTARRFRAASSGPPIAAAQVGTRVRYRLSEPAVVTLRYEKGAGGRRVGGRCRKLTRENRGRPKCVRWNLLDGSVARTGATGANSFRLTGRWRGAALPPASYRLRLTARDAARNADQATSPVFGIVRK